MSGRSAKVLLVEDDLVDVKGIRRSFTNWGLRNEIHVAEDGQTALSMLRGDNATTPLSRPYVVLLDLNMPRMNGFEFLEEIRSDVVLKDSVVFVLTTSIDKQDKMRAYAHNVAGYVVKSNRQDAHAQIAELLERYLSLVDLPQR